MGDTVSKAPPFSLAPLVLCSLKHLLARAGVAILHDASHSLAQVVRANAAAIFKVRHNKKMASGSVYDLLSQSREYTKFRSTVPERKVFQLCCVVSFCCESACFANCCMFDLL